MSSRPAIIRNHVDSIIESYKTVQVFGKTELSLQNKKEYK